MVSLNSVNVVCVPAYVKNVCDMVKTQIQPQAHESQKQNLEMGKLSISLW